jgi:hypothetical protein
MVVERERINFTPQAVAHTPPAENMVHALQKKAAST